MNNRRRLFQFVETALALPEPEREPWLRKACGIDEALFQQAMALIEADGQDTAQFEAGPPRKIDPDDFSGKTIGVWRLLRELGRGGMGSVWLAERSDGELRMRVAMKIIQSEVVSPELLYRFRRERQIMADLNHPHVGRFYDAGATEDGKPWLAMEYVDGDTIDNYCDNNNLLRGERLQLFRQACEAVAFAHRRGVIHRDLKPANIMVNTEGIVKLLDFGIALLNAEMHNNAEESQEGQLIMTPAYASPEQLQGMPAGVASDIYSLALVLCELLTGLKPKDLKPDPGGIVENALLDSEMTVNTQERTDMLVALLIKALDPEQNKRHSSVQTLIDDLDACRQNEPVPDDPKDILYDALVWYGEEDRDAVEKLALNLEQKHELKLWGVWRESVPGEHIGDAHEQAMTESGALLVCVGAGEPWNHEYVRTILEARIGKRRVIPIVLPGGERPQRESGLPSFLRRRAWGRITHEGDPVELERLAKSIVGKEIEDDGIEITSTCPFKGLEAFGEDDARFFYGREAATQRLTEHMVRNRFLAVLGPSGSGKSSVVQAGLLPKMRGRGFTPIRFTPTANPLAELAYSIYKILPEGHREPPEQLLQRLNAGDEALSFILREYLDGEIGQKLCFTIDQFEELFTLAQDHYEVSRFLANILNVIEQPKSDISMVLTLRSDFVGKCANWPNLNTWLGDHFIQLGPMSREELGRAIEEPARIAGLRFEKGLVKRILDDVAGSPGELPLLEHALLEMWERRRGRTLTLEAYLDIGGIEGALAQRAESEYTSLDDGQKSLLRKMFTLCLIHPGEGAEDTRRRASREELLAVGDNPDQIEELLSRWTEARLLTGHSDEARDEGLIDVAHEALIRRWERITIWMAEDRETARLLSRLRRMAREWDEEGRDNDRLLRGGPLFQMQESLTLTSGTLELEYLEASLHHQEKRQIEGERRRKLALVAGFLGLVLAAFAFYLYNDASKAREIATQETIKAEQKAKENNHNLALIYTREAKFALEGKNPRAALLYTLAALSQDIPPDRSLPEAFGVLIRPELEKANHLLWTSPTYPEPRHAAISTDNRLVALTCADNSIRIVEIGNPAPKAVFRGHQEAVEQLSFSPDGSLLIAAAGNSLLVWQVKMDNFWVFDRPVLEFKEHPSAVTRIQFEGNKPISIDDSGNAWRHNPQTGTSQPVRFSDKRSEQPVLKTDLNLQTPNGHILKHTTPVVAWSTSTAKDLLVSCTERGSVQLWRQSTGEPIAAFDALLDREKGRDDLRIHHIAISEDGTLLTIVGEPDIPLIWSVDPTGKHFKPLASLPGHRNYISDVAFSPDGKEIASASGDKSIKIWDSNTGACLNTLYEHEDEVKALAYSPNDSILASASGDTVIFWQVEESGSYQKNHVFKQKNASVNDIAFSSDGSLLAATSGSSVLIWQSSPTHINQQPLILEDHSDQLNHISFSKTQPDILASSSIDGKVIVWRIRDQGDSHTGEPIHTLSAPGQIRGVAFSPDGKWIAGASSTSDVFLWKTADFRVRQNVSPQKPDLTFNEHTSDVFAVSFSPDSHYLASVSRDLSFIIRSVSKHIENENLASQPLVLKGHTDVIMDLDISQDGKRLVTTGQDKSLRVWAAPTFKDLLSFQYDQDSLRMDISPDADRIALSSADGAVHLFHVNQSVSSEGIQSIQGKANTEDLSFSRDGNWMAMASDDNNVTIWSATGPEVNLKATLPHPKRIYCVAFSPKNQLATGSRDKILRLFELENIDANQTFVKAPTELHGHTGVIIDVAFDPHGKILASASSDRTVKLWDPIEKRELQTLSGHRDSVYKVAFSRDGNYLASASGDQTVRLWRMPQGEFIRAFQDHGDWVSSLAISPDNTTLATKSGDGFLRLFDIKTGELIAVTESNNGSQNFISSQLLVSASKKKGPETKNLASLLLLKAAEKENLNYASILQQTLFHFGYRMDGLQLKTENRFTLELLEDQVQASNYIRPEAQTLLEWLVTINNSNAKHAKAILP